MAVATAPPQRGAGLAKDRMVPTPERGFRFLEGFRIFRSRGSDGEGESLDVERVNRDKFDNSCFRDVSQYITGHVFCVCCLCGRGGFVFLEGFRVLGEVSTGRRRSEGGGGAARAL